jgi:ribosomal protein L40E
MAITCPSCGMDNSETATECRRCRAPFGNPPTEELSGALGIVCARCEAYNEPGVTRCTTCGYKLEAPAPPQMAEPAPEAPMTPAAATDEASLSEELRALAISPEEAADAGLQVPPPPPQRTRTNPASEASPMGGASMRSPSAPRTPPPAAVQPEADWPADPLAAANKTCASCWTENPPTAKFCAECGTPFAKQEPPPTVSVHMDEEPPALEAPQSWAASTDPTARVFDERATADPPQFELQDPSPEPLGWDEPAANPLPEEPEVDFAATAEASEEGSAPEPEPPYPAALVVERGSAAGTTYLLGRIENVLGGAGAPVELPEDPHLAPRHAAIVFEEQRLVLRDEGSVNGVYVKVRESAPIEPGDLFIAGERLLRYDGPCELPVGEVGETPYLGSPRPQGQAVRVSEMLQGGKTGRICFRTGPSVAVGRTGCDLNFASDAQLGPRHAELRIDEDGSATLVDLGGGPGGVFLRVRPQQTFELQGGDVLQIGEQVLRVEVG